MMAAVLISLSLALPILAQSPSYAPLISQTCPPSSTLLRLTGVPTSNNQTLSSSESAYQSRRSSVLSPLWSSFLSSGPGSLTGYPASVLNTGGRQPKLGIAVSGGGYRAALYGAGALSSLDSRTGNDSLGGYLQLTSYLSGISGGSWLVSSLAAHSYPPLRTLVLGSSPSSGDGWNLDLNLIAPLDIPTIDPVTFVSNLIPDVEAKEKAVSNSTSFIDLWGRALSYHFATGTTRSNFDEKDGDTGHGAGLLWGPSVTSTDAWSSAQAPFPIVVGNALPGGRTVAVVPLNQTIYEFNPFEFGSFDPTLSGFMNITYLGTNLTSGTPMNSTSCVQGWDNFGFVIGTSSNLFPQEISSFSEAFFDAAPLSVVRDALRNIGQDVQDSGFVQAKVPNPFVGVNQGSYEDTQTAVLPLADGGLNLASLPVESLAVPARQVDVIIGLDATADTAENYPNGSAIVNSYLRTSLPILSGPNGGPTLPPIPSNESAFVSLGLNVRPTFFGCGINGDANVSSVPLIVYLPNSPYPHKVSEQDQQSVKGPSSQATTKLDYSDDEVRAFLDYTGNATLRGWPEGLGRNDTDQQWPACLACATLERARERAGVQRSQTCETCFQRYCYYSSMPVPQNVSLASYNSSTPVTGRNTGAATSVAKGTWMAMVGPGLVIIAIFGMTM